MSAQSSKTSDAIRQGVPRMPSYSNPAAQDDKDDNNRLKLPKRAHTFQNGSPHEIRPHNYEDATPDAFEAGDHSETEDNTETARPSVDLDELPIELITLTDRYVNIKVLIQAHFRAPQSF